jgi:hypothetical protein
VSWITDNAETGYVNYGISPENLNITAYDDRGQSIADDTHHVTITGLNPGTTYYYEIVIGGVICDNNGTPYQMTTGPNLVFTMPEVINGRVYKNGGVGAEGAIVYVTIGTSQVLTGLVNDQGVWALDIAPIRTADIQAYFEYTNTDNISLDIHGGGAGTATVTTTVATVKGGTLETTLAGGTEQDATTTSPDGNAGGGTIFDGDQPGTSTAQSGGVRLWVWLASGLATLTITGFLLKKFVYYHD